MCLKVIQALLSYVIVYVIAFEDIIYVYGQVSQELVDQGRTQYQLLQERSSLPQYGNCWKSAIEHVDEGCRALTEDTQSDMALHLTNCFLEMAGHETYNCVFDRKPNLKAICMQSMTDRAFNVYTEFYTHTQNICWFLRGQIWHETIAENTLRVGKQLESSAKNQEEIITSQKESLALQEKLLNYGQNLEQIMEEFYISTRQHQEILSVMSQSLGSLQSWLVGELSWFDLVVFYVSAAMLIVIFTSSLRTAAARLPILFLLVLNGLIERLICAAFIANTAQHEIHLVQNEIYQYIWWVRKIFIVLSVGILIYQLFFYKDLIRVNNGLLQKIYNQNVSILEKIQNSNRQFTNGSISFIDEAATPKIHSFNASLNLNGSSYKVNNYVEEKEETYEKTVHTNGLLIHTPYDKDINILRNTFNETVRSNAPKDKVPFNKLISGRQRLTPFNELQTNGRYNLRRKQGTPDSNI